MLDNNFDNNEELEIVNITEDESRAEEEVKEEKKTTDSAGEEEKESEYEDVCFICRRPEKQDGQNVQAAQPYLRVLRLYAQDNGHGQPV